MSSGPQENEELRVAIPVETEEQGPQTALTVDDDEEQQQTDDSSQPRSTRTTNRSQEPARGRVATENPRSSRHQEEEMPPPRPVEPGVVTATEFGGYFTEDETKCMAYVVLVLSVIAACLVIVSQTYRLAVLDPPCSDAQIAANATNCDEEDTGLSYLSSVLSLLVSLSIPLCGLYGSMFKAIEALQVFRFLSGLFGLYAVLQLATTAFDPEGTAESFTNCNFGDPCLSTYYVLEVLYSISYLILNVYFSGSLISKIESIEHRAQNIEVNAADANIVRDAAIVRILDENTQEEDFIHPLARAVPLSSGSSTNGSPKPPRKSRRFGSRSSKKV